MSKTRIIFTGDISFSKHFQDGWQKRGTVSEEIRSYLQTTEYVVGNVECALTAREIQSSRTLNHASDPGAGAFLRALNVRYWNLANNHIMDCGAEGLLDTLQTAEQNACKTLGAGKNMREAAESLILGDDVRVGILSVAKPWEFLCGEADAPCAFTWNRKAELAEAIAALRKTVRWVVIVAHGGDEYSDLALPYMREQYHAFLDLGADIVVAHHPHVIQNYELLDNKAIFYSLGNFIFDTDNQRKFQHTNAGMLIGIDFAADSFTFDTCPVAIDRESHTVKRGAAPVNFCSLDSETYQKLWPLEARAFYRTDLKKRKLLSKRLASSPGLFVLGHEVLLCRNRRERVIHKGRLLSLFGKWKKAENQALIQYIKGA